ncbi:MAG: ribonuclease P protein component [Candidatus Dojkabacteria bacterium]
MLPYLHRLNSKEISKVYNEGKKYRGEFGMLVVLQSKENIAQFAFVVNKKIGNAVLRHRMTRLLREITMEVIKEHDFENKPFKCQYIAFKYCDNYEKLKEEYSEQIKTAFRDS